MSFFVFLPSVLLAAQIVVLSAMRLVFPSGYPDPFAPYDAVMPNQPSDALRMYTCNYTHAGNGSLDMCRIALNEGPLAAVDVYFYGHRIRGITFHANQIYVADLIRRWGYPDRIERERMYFFLIWENGVRASAALANHFNYRLRVLSISLILEPTAAVTSGD